MYRGLVPPFATCLRHDRNVGASPFCDPKWRKTLLHAHVNTAKCTCREGCLVDAVESVTFRRSFGVSTNYFFRRRDDETRNERHNKRNVVGVDDEKPTVRVDNIYGWT